MLLNLISFELNYDSPSEKKKYIIFNSAKAEKREQTINRMGTQNNFNLTFCPE